MTNYLESGTDADYAPNLETFADEEYDLIISIGYVGGCYQNRCRAESGYQVCYCR